jgi:hypothetical protein
LVPVTIAAGAETASRQADEHAETMISSGGAIHIELPGRAMISIETGADPALLRCVLESLRK